MKVAIRQMEINNVVHELNCECSQSMYTFVNGLCLWPTYAMIAGAKDNNYVFAILKFSKMSISYGHSNS